MLVLHWHWPLRQVFGGRFAYAGLALVALGLVMNLWASNSFQAARTTIKPFETPKALVTRGIYRYTRNPMYLGMLLILIGLWLSLGTLSPGLAVPPLVWVIRTRFIGPEEKQLEEVFGEGFRTYCSAVRRWI